MFIIHDGLPSKYTSIEDGISDTKNAIADCRKAGIKTIGLGINISQAFDMKQMYSEKGYIDVGNGTSIAKNIEKILKSELKKY